MIVLGRSRSETTPSGTMGGVTQKAPPGGEHEGGSHGITGEANVGGVHAATQASIETCSRYIEEISVPSSGSMLVTSVLSSSVRGSYSAVR